MAKQLDGKVAVITGSATGIGNAIARRFGAEGAKIIIADRQGAEDAAEELRATGIEAFAVTVDVSDEAATAEMAKAAVAEFGGINILINNAAIFTGLNDTPIEELKVTEWRQLMDVNVMGPWLCVKACAAELEKQQGSVINIASVIAHVGIPFMLHYVASKGAVLAMTRGMARELGARGIRVNSISPGYTHSANAQHNTEQHEQFESVAASMRTLSRAQKPEDLAGAAVFLAAADGGFITGQNIIVDGGMYLGM